MLTDGMVKVWQQDDAIQRYHEDYESAFTAYARICGEPHRDADEVDVIDHGDECLHVMRNGWVIVSSGCCESCVYRPA